MSQASDRGSALYERIGGQAAVGELIDDFYERVLTDPKLAPFFTDSSMSHLRTMQREFFAAALGGPIRYSGPSLAEIHVGRASERGTSRASSSTCSTPCVRAGSTKRTP